MPHDRCTTRPRLVAPRPILVMTERHQQPIVVEVDKRLLQIRTAKCRPTSLLTRPLENGIKYAHVQRRKRWMFVRGDSPMPDDETKTRNARRCGDSFPVGRPTSQITTYRFRFCQMWYCVPRRHPTCTKHRRAGSPAARRTILKGRSSPAATSCPVGSLADVNCRVQTLSHSRGMRSSAHAGAHPPPVRHPRRPDRGGVFEPRRCIVVLTRTGPRTNSSSVSQRGRTPATRRRSTPTLRICRAMRSHVHRQRIAMPHIIRPRVAHKHGTHARRSPHNGTAPASRARRRSTRGRGRRPPRRSDPIIGDLLAV